MDSKSLLSLYTAELDSLEIILRAFINNRTYQAKSFKQERELANKLLEAIDQKDEAWLVY